jgi:hypothetical protein
MTVRDLPEQTVKLTDRPAYRRAAPNTLIELAPVPGDLPQSIPKECAEVIHDAIASHDRIHASGPTGSGKSAALRAIIHPPNFDLLCEHRGLPCKPLFSSVIAAASFAEPSDWWYEVGIGPDGATYKRPSPVLRFLIEAERLGTSHYSLLWIQEGGRAPKGVSNGSLDIVTKGVIHLPTGETVRTDDVAILMDSNYQAKRDDTYGVDLEDAAERRRYDVNVTFKYLPPEQEAAILKRLAAREGLRVTEEQIREIVLLGKLIREAKRKGELTSLIAPNIGAYLCYLKKLTRFPDYSPDKVAGWTLLGNAQSDDLETIQNLISKVYAVASDDEELEPETTIV